MKFSTQLALLITLLLTSLFGQTVMAADPTTDTAGGTTVQTAAETPAADAPATTAPSTEASASATPQPTEETCIPKCRAGFMCHAGLCISQCNPPCGAGYACTADGQCVMQQSAPAAVYASPPPPTERELARQQARERKMEIRTRRKEKVKRLRLAAHMDWQWMFTGDTDDVYRTGFVGNLGIQKNVADTFAIRARLGGMIGYARPEFFSDGERTTCWGANIDVSPLFGPLGTFYIGPTLWMTYYWHGKDELENTDYWDDVVDVVHTNDGPIGGIALDMGLLIGDDANLGVNWRLKTTLTENPSFIFEFGLAYHFDVGGK